MKDVSYILRQKHLTGFFHLGFVAVAGNGGMASFIYGRFVKRRQYKNKLEWINEDINDCVAKLEKGDCNFKGRIRDQPIVVKDTYINL